MFSVDWTALFPHLRQEVEVRVVSDHNPVVLDSNPPKWGPSPFRFENMWLEHKGFDKAFEKWWKECMVHGWEGYQFLSRLKCIKPLVKKWNLEIFGDLRLKEADFNRRLGELDGMEGTSRWNVDLVEEQKRIKRELSELLIVKERSVRLKARVQCAKEGDANSKFFHGLLNARQSKNSVTRIEKDNGEIVDSKEEIVNEIVDFFKNLYSSAHGNVSGFEGVEWK